MFLSNYMENGFLQAMRGVSFTAPTEIFCGLFLSSPGDSGTEGTEIAYTGYQRMKIVFTPPTIGSGGIEVKNTEQVTYPQSPIDAGTVRHIGIFDAQTGGNMYLYGQLTEDLPILTGESPVLLINEVLYFTIGDMSIAYKAKLFNIVRGIPLPGFTSYCALYNGSPQSGGAELSGTNYARVPLTFSAPDSADASGLMTIRNSIAADFNRPTTNWGNWTHTAIMDRVSSGEVVWLQQRTTPKLLNRGIMPMIAEGAITIGVN